MRKILVIIDMQNDFIDGVLGNEYTRVVVNKVVEKIKNFNGNRIVCTMDSHNQDYLATQEGQKLPVIHCVIGTEGWQLNEEIDVALNKKLSQEQVSINSITKSTFGSLKLADFLQNFADEEMEIELCGVCTGICVISNAMILKAKFPNIKISVDASCCACVTPESHKNALEAMKMCQIDIINE